MKDKKSGGVKNGIQAAGSGILTAYPAS